MLSYEYYEIFKNTYFEENLGMPASVFIHIHKTISFYFNAIPKEYAVFDSCQIKTPPEVYTEPCQISKMKGLAKIVNG